MSSLDKVACVTYTTSKYADVWPIHFGQLEKHLGGIKSYVLSDFGSNKKFNFEKHTLVEHEDAKPYFMQYLAGLEQVSEDFIIYLQDDFFLYDDVDHERVAAVRDFLENSDYDYVRMIRCGYQTPLNKHIKNNLFEVDMTTQDAFSMQATMWKKNRMQQLYAHVGSTKWLEGEHWNTGCRQIGIKGAFTWNGEPQIGKFHYDSVTWPYCCTAVCKGQWAMDEYPEIMARLVKEYNIDVSIRGVRKPRR
jgi:hypothetical protein